MSKDAPFSNKDCVKRLSGTFHESPSYIRLARISCIQLGTLSRAKSSTDSSSSVVFSYWTTTLDLIEKGLKEASIPYARFDGSVSSQNRSLVLDNFRREREISVILMTISCASVG